MHTQIIELLAGIASIAIATMALRAWVLLKKGVNGSAITVVNKENGKTATLPRNYSPAAVEQLLELTT